MDSGDGRTDGNGVATGALSVLLGQWGLGSASNTATLARAWVR